MGKTTNVEEALASNGLLNKEQRQQARIRAQQSNETFAEAAVKLGFADEASIARTLAQVLEFPYASRENKLLRIETDQDLETIVPENFAREHLVVPLFLDDKILSVALANPEDMMTIENLKLLTGCEIQPCVAAKSELLKLVDELYRTLSGDLIAKTLSESEVEEVVEAGPSDVRVDLDKAIDAGRGAMAVNLVNAILRQSVKERASDIHLEAYEDEDVLLRFRIDGVLYRRTPPPRQNFLAVISRIKILSKLNIAERRVPQDGSFALKVQNRIIDIRVSVCPAAYGEKIVMRLLDKETVPLNMENLGFSPRQKKDFLAGATEPHGLCLLTGPTGSGKTTTLYAVLNTIKTTGKNFMTVEDPIEIRLRGITQVQVKNDVGLDFSTALRSFLRQDPDVILVGEIRDIETASTCLRAALTGHLVLSTLHTNNALSAIVRLIDLGVEPFLLASSLSLVAAQRLIRILCPSCKIPYTPTPEQVRACLNEFGSEMVIDPAKVIFHRATGCKECVGTGFKGRKAIYEVYRIGPEMRDVITTTGGRLKELQHAAAAQGMWDLRTSGWDKVLKGMTTPQEVIAASTH